jgi:predicted AAA+ superfamily ATPase
MDCHDNLDLMLESSLPRTLRLPTAGSETFFLWGPRQVGKTTLLRHTYPQAIWIDLLKADEFRRYTSRPERLREELLAIPETMRPLQIVIDEIQKIPALLDEVHWLHENHGIQFALCGSSARKLRHGGVNLLGGRALRYELGGLTARELGDAFDVERIANNGSLPRIYAADRAPRLLNAYVSDYLQQEIAAESLVRNLPAFSDFLAAASLSDAEIVNQLNIARECGVSASTVTNYFEILTDTLLGHWLKAYTKRPKRRVIQAPKFYFADVGIVNHLARRGHMAPGSELFGKAFESWVHHELRLWLRYREAPTALTYWRLASGIEVDFVIDDLSLALEAKSSRTITDAHLKGLRQLAVDQTVRQRVVVCLEPKRRVTNDGITIVPAGELAAFLDEIAEGQ